MYNTVEEGTRDQETPDSTWAYVLGLGGPSNKTAVVVQVSAKDNGFSTASFGPVLPEVCLLNTEITNSQKYEDILQCQETSILPTFDEVESTRARSKLKGDHGRKTTSFKCKQVNVPFPATLGYQTKAVSILALKD